MENDCGHLGIKNVHNGGCVRIEKEGERSLAVECGFVTVTE